MGIDSNSRMKLWLQRRFLRSHLNIFYLISIIWIMLIVCSICAWIISSPENTLFYVFNEQNIGSDQDQLVLLWYDWITMHITYVPQECLFYFIIPVHD